MKTALFMGVASALTVTTLAAPPKGQPFATPPKAVTPVAALKATRPAPMWAVTFAPDGKTIAVGTYRRVLIFDTQTGAKTAEWPVSSEAIRALAYSADGTRLACGTGVPGESGAVIVVDTKTGKPVRVVKNHADTVEAVAFKDNFLLAASDDERVSVTDLASGKDVGTLSEHIGRCLSVAVPSKTSDANGGDLFATGGSDNAVKIWDARVRRVVVNFDQSQGPVWCLAFLHQPGRFVAGGGDGRIRFFGIVADGKASGIAEGIPARTGYQEREFAAHENGVYGLAVSPDDSFLASGGADGKLVLWNTGGGRRKTFADAADDIVGVAISPDGKQVASASLDGKLRIYDAQKGGMLFDLPQNVAAVGATPPVTAQPANVAVSSGKPATGTGLLARWFGGTELSDKPLLVRLEGNLAYTMSSDQSPAPGVPGENVSARWEGFVEAPVAGAYTFSTRSDDGVRLWVNGTQVVDNWTDHAPVDDFAPRPVTLTAGQRVPIRLEWFQGGGGGEISLLWSYPGQERQAIPKTRLYPPAPAASGAAKKP